MRNFFIVLVLLLTSFSAKATHLVGSDIYYDYLGNDQYRITLILFRDCLSNGAAFDNPMRVAIYDENGGLFQQLDLPFTGSTPTPIDFSNPCVTPPSNVCVESTTYTAVVTLPANVGGYTVSHQRCCYGGSISNIEDPEDTGLTLTTHIPGNGLDNSSARFVNYPPIIICNNVNLNMDHYATDPDGDDLVYEMVTPLEGGSSITPIPNPPAGPPFFDVVWETGFSATAPLGPGSTTTIDPDSGELFADANQLGKYVVGIRVLEYRNGVLIGSTMRTFIFIVISCNVTLDAVVADQEDSPTFVSYCQGLTWTFDNQSFGGNNYSWDFGVPGITTDVSTAYEPTYTYPSPGTYTARLVVNPGWPCTDTAFVTVQLYDAFNVDFTFQEDSTCFAGNSVDFQGQVLEGSEAPTFTWNFSSLGVPQTATGIAVNDVHFNQGGNHNVWFKGTTEHCVDSIMHKVFVFPDPIPAQSLPDGYECDGLTQTFINTSQNASVYQWDFGVPGTTTDVSTEANPTFTFPAPGTYTVTLTAGIPEGCSNTLQVEYTVYESLSVAFTHPDSLCFYDHSFDFDAEVNGPPITTYQWNFGPNATPTSATTEDVANVVYNAPGLYNVTLTASFLECSETATSTVFIFEDPIADPSLPDDYTCKGLTQTFVNNSQNATVYLWDFGVPGTTTDVSTAANPTFTFPAPGTYTITLTAGIPEGCTNTVQVEYTIYEKLSISFTHTDSLCITNNSYDFNGEMTGPPITTYQWEFGPNATPSSATTLDVTNVVYSEPGLFPVTLTASFLECTETASSSVLVFQEPVIDFGILPGLQCPPFTAHFVDKSEADSEIQYFWDFGDGGTSNEQNPVHPYVGSGLFPVTLQIVTTEGCKDTLSLTLNLVDIKPAPFAGFDVTPSLTDVCNSTVSFINTSEGGYTYIYQFDDIINSASEEENPHYTYLGAGYHYPLQIVRSEFGCSDSASATILVEPYTVYIPNAFTPGGSDELNNTLKTVAALGPVEWEFKIYNRWGELVFESTDPNAEWDGTYNGSPAPEGIYSYTLRYVSCASGDHWDDLSGHISLIR